MYTESRLRTIAKTISWRFLATLTTIAIVFYFTGEIAVAATVGGAEVIAKIILYFLHERGWNLIESGKHSQASKIALIRKSQQRGCVIWLTGLSASGKSTIALSLEQQLLSSGYLSYVLDGDNVRQGLNSDLSFSAEDRTENIRRLGEVASLFADARVIVITAFISPYRKDRARARKLVESKGAQFIEIYLSTPLEVCKNRDPKGLYRKAQSGILKDFTGISAPYEPPQDPELTFDTSQKSVSACIEVTTDYLNQMLFTPDPKNIDKALRML